MSEYDIKKNIEGLKHKLADEEAKLKALEELTEIELLAMDLHGRLCRWNHSDGCSWYYHMNYDVPTWNADVQQEYLQKARHVKRWCDTNNVELSNIRNLLNLILK